MVLDNTDPLIKGKKYFGILILKNDFSLFSPNYNANTVSMARRYCLIPPRHAHGITTIQLFEPDGNSIPIELMRFYYITTGFFIKSVVLANTTLFAKSVVLCQYHESGS